MKCNISSSIMCSRSWHISASVQGRASVAMSHCAPSLVVRHKLVDWRPSLSVSRANNIVDYDMADMKKWMKCIFPVSLKKKTANAAAEINQSIAVSDDQIDATDRHNTDARKALRLLVATGEERKDLNVAIAEVLCGGIGPSCSRKNEDSSQSPGQAWPPR